MTRRLVLGATLSAARAAVVVAVVVGAVGAAGCSARDGRPAAWVQRAAVQSVTADTLAARGDLEAARAALVGLVDAPVAPGVDGNDRRAVLMDAYGRLAAIEVGLGRPAAARAWVDRGLALGERTDLFTANLLLAQGHALEAGGAAPRAAASYHRALMINEALLTAVLGGRAGEPAR